MMYRCIPEFDDNDCLLWHVYELSTEQVVESFLFEDDAQDFMKQLERGKGFNGFTPSFMLRKTRSISDINDAFSAEFA